MAWVYVVAVSTAEAAELAQEYGHDSKGEAERHLAEVKAFPTDGVYAHQYRVYKVRSDDGSGAVRS